MNLSFFFSSRRRHTRSYGDWSSDVCSSDLQHDIVIAAHFLEGALEDFSRILVVAGIEFLICLGYPTRQIGRASCRERVWRSAVALYSQEPNNNQADE